MSLLKAEKIHKKFLTPQEITVIREISLEVKKGESVAIIGASGEGKSTLLQILGTLEPQTSGSLQIAGTHVTPANAPLVRNRHIGFVFQAFHLLEDYTAIENVLMPAKIAGHNTSKDSKSYARALSLFEKVGVSDRKHFRTNLLSGGEKQRVAIARALCNDPDLIFADEPSGNLDHGTAKQIHALLLTLCKEHQKGLIVVTHNMDLAHLCDRIYTLSDGALQ